MGRLFLEYLDCEKLYACKKCLTHIVDGKQLVSKVSIHKTTSKNPLIPTNKKPQISFCSSDSRMGTENKNGLVQNVDLGEMEGNSEESWID